MRWWPFHRRKHRPPVNGEAAKKAKAEAAAAVRDAVCRKQDIEREFSRFAAQVEAAMRGQR